MKSVRLVMIAVCTAAMILSACGAPAAEAGITVKDAWARPSAMSEPTPTAKSGMDSSMGGMTKTMSMDMGMNGPVSAVYLTLQNGSNKADKLVSVVTTAAAVSEVHETFTKDGMMGMRPVQGGLEIPANGSVSLKPGSYHIMLMDLKDQLKEGQTIKVSLKFASGKQIDVDVPVKAVTAQ